ncbi:MAG: bacteriohemerythrin [Candidatus Parabeggiatoa sp.]|nr:bacteriohemerythrin [Candidatus Parabeggiatoa sp.]
MLKDIKINQKLALMVVIPIVGLIYFTIALTLEKRDIVHEMNLLQELSELTVKSSSLIHELQKERGMSAGFLGSQGVKFSKELQRQRVNTDKSITELEYFVKDFNFKAFSNEIQDMLDIIFAELDSIKNRRKLIDDLKFSVETQISYYNTIVNSLLIGINYLSKIISHAELSNRVVAYVNLLQAKEKAGLERATLNNAFSQSHFAPGMYKTFVLQVGAQEVYINNFLFFATAKQKALYYKTMQGDFVNHVEKIRTLAFKKSVKFQFISSLYAHIGYGGLIYQLNNYILWGESKYLDAFHQQYNSAFTILNIYKNLPYISQAEIEHIEIIENTFNTYKQYLVKTIELKDQNKSVDEIDPILKIDDAPVIKALNQLLTGSRLDIEPTYWWKMATGKINLFRILENNFATDLKVSAETLKKEAQSTFILSLIITGITILSTLSLSYFFACGITKPLKNLVNMANQISSGNRNISLKVNSRDETGQLSSAMMLMLYSIKRSEAILRETNEAYARFVPNEFLQLLKKEQIVDIQLGNNLEMNMTVQFVDIRSFTALSERMSPQENFNFINAYLKEMCPIIREYNGFIDKYIGDAIMALFINADDALKASIVMLQMLDFLNDIQKAKAQAPIKIGIGLNTGKLMLGIIGEENRLQCTVISDAVNLASRLEGTTKTYKNTLIISQNTFNNLRNPQEYAIRFLEKIKVKGRTERVNIFEVFDGDIKEIRDAKLATLNHFEKAVHLYQEHKFCEVETLMQNCLRKNSHDVAAEVYLQRCQNFLKLDYSTNWEEMAKIVEWGPHLHINDPVIDQQHKELFIRIKNLIMSIGTGKTEEEVDEIVNFLESYISTHFQLEEMQMEQCHYPNSALHKAHHVEFIETVNHIKKNYQKKGGNLYLALQIQQEIVEWLTVHIGEYDQELGQFMNSKP